MVLWLWHRSGIAQDPVWAVQPHNKGRSLSSPGSALLTRVSCSVASLWASSAYLGKEELRGFLAPFSPFLGLKSLWCDSTTPQDTLLLWLVELESWEWRMKELGHAMLCGTWNWQRPRFAPCQHCALPTGVLVTSPSHIWTSGVNQSPQKPDKSSPLISRVSRLSLLREVSWFRLDITWHKRIFSCEMLWSRW